MPPVGWRDYPALRKKILHIAEAQGEATLSLPLPEIGDIILGERDIAGTGPSEMGSNPAVEFRQQVERNLRKDMVFDMVWHVPCEETDDV